MGTFEQAWVSTLSAGVAGSAAAWVTTPFDVVKTRSMLQVGVGDSREVDRVSGRRLLDNDGDRRRPQQGSRSAVQVGREVLQVEGVRGLFRGGLVRATFTVVGNGLYMGCYEGAKHYLQDVQEAM